ncbi:hypothetical protein HMPREF1982_02883 [Clostridiales bacterium oral taxon 876 str. F0540]|nr:hypothetical protein HMPREF1982_02883 [Clostridiales bacterium oral taxon 876 str. F0540]
MVKNNLKSLLIHIIISFLSLIVFIIFHSSAVKWASEESARRHHNFMMIIALILICGSILFYYYLSGRFCSKENNILNNLFSVSITAIVGIILWIIAFAIEPSGVGGQLLNFKLWVGYAAYNSYAMFLINEIRINNSYVLIVFSLVPTLVMYLGLKRKAE